MYKVRGDEYGKIADNVVIAILKKELPAALQRMGLNKPLSDAELDDLAYYLLDYAKACDRNTLDQIQETKTIQIVKQPTPQQCKDLQEFLEQIVRISVVSKDYQVNKHLIKNSIGKIWSIIQSEEREKAIFENEMRTPNSVVGDRG
jgi:hypothetical protein